jgi:hypothetical protein
MTIKEIVVEYLKASGFDGLAGEECGCLIADDCPCGEPPVDVCVPGYRWDSCEKCPDKGCDFRNHQDEFVGGYCVREEKP